MAAKNSADSPRPSRIPIDSGSWWPRRAMDAAVERARGLGIRAPGLRSLAAELRTRGVQADEDTVGRNLRGEIVTWEVAVPLSAILGIAPPAVMPETDDEAQVIATILDKLRAVRR